MVIPKVCFHGEKFVGFFCLLGPMDADLTFAVGGVESLVSLDEDVPGLEGHHHHFLQQPVWELSLQVHVLLNVGILIEACCRNL